MAISSLQNVSSFQSSTAWSENFNIYLVGLRSCISAMTILKTFFASLSKPSPLAPMELPISSSTLSSAGPANFPVKDPFFAMSRRSLNTFMNALTGSDFTCYPAASQVEKDFYNLLEVYIDAVFHPELKNMSFLQEGHRLEFAEPKDPKPL